MNSLFFILSLSFILVSFNGCSGKNEFTKSTSKARHQATMRSYTVHGKRYHPTYAEVGQEMRGIASWYGPNFHGKKTSNGEDYDMYARTAAHKTWPMDTMVRVKNLDNGKSTVVRINDRGPFVQGRIIDCSYRAGKELGLDRTGVAKVEIQVIGFSGAVHSQRMIAEQQRSHSQQRIKLTNFGVQVGAFRRHEGAEVYKRRYQSFDDRYYPVIKRFDYVDGAPLYRVWLMGFGSEMEARDFKDSHNLPGAFIVRQ